MKTITEISLFLYDFMRFVMVLAVIITAFIMLGVSIDSNNPCSNFSDHGSCEGGIL